MKLSEHQLQQQVVSYLRLKGVFCFAVSNGVWFNEKNKLKQIKYIKYLKSEGFLNGVSDLIVLMPQKRAVFLELKVGSNKLSKYQELFKKEVEERDFEHHVIRSLDDIMKIF